MKKLLVLVLTLALALGPWALGAFAEEGAFLDLRSQTGDASGQGWRWDADQAMLTLDGLDVTTPGDGILLPDHASLTLYGFNRLAAGGTALILGENSLTAVQGDGTLYVGACARAVTGHSLALNEGVALHLKGRVELTDRLMVLQGGLAADGIYTAQGVFAATGLVAKTGNLTQVAAQPSQALALFWEEPVAVGQVKTLTLTGPQGLTLTGAGSYVAGELVSVDAAPAQLFQDWSLGELGAVSRQDTQLSFVMPARALELRSLGRQTHTVTLQAQPGGGVLGTSGAFAQGQVLRVEAVAQPGWVFTGWQAPAGELADPSSPVTDFTVPDQDVTLLATFRPLETGLTVTATEGGTVNLPSGSYLPGQVLELVATPQPGWVFDHWEATAGVPSDPFGAATQYTVPAGPAQITACFVPDPSAQSFTLTVLSSDPLGGTVNLSQESLMPGQSVELSLTLADPLTWYFAGWQASAGELSEPQSLVCTFTMPNQDVTVVADLRRFVNTLRVEATQGGAVYDETGGVAEGDQALTELRRVNSRSTFVAQPDPGYLFSHWSVTAGVLADTLSPTLSYAMADRDVVLRAHFVPEDSVTGGFRVLVQAGEGGRLGVDVSGWYPKGSAVALQARCNDGFRFVRWVVTDESGNPLTGCVDYPELESATLTVPAQSLRIAAEFAPLATLPGAGPVKTTAPAQSSATAPVTTQPPKTSTPSQSGSVWGVALVCLLVAGLGIAWAVYTQRRRNRGQSSLFKELCAKRRMKRLEAEQRKNKK